MFRARANNADQVNQESAATQPRPALGRRPWFALLRRARSLRRFALAIEPGSVAAFGRLVAIVAEDRSWDASPVVVASTARQRRLGVKTGVDMVLLRTRAVHGRGLSRGLRLVAISGDGVVVATRLLLPGGFVWLAEATWVLELPLSAQQPRIGMALAIYPQRCARTTSLVRYPDR